MDKLCSEGIDEFYPGERATVLEVFGVKLLYAAGDGRRHDEAVVKAILRFPVQRQRVRVQSPAWEDAARRPEQRLMQVPQIPRRHRSREPVQRHGGKFLHNLPANRPLAIGPLSHDIERPPLLLRGRLIEGIDEHIRIQEDSSAHSSPRG